MTYDIDTQCRTTGRFPYDRPMPFVPPDPGTRLYLTDEREWTTYGDLLRQMDELFAPYDRASLDMFMTTMGALTEAEVRRMGGTEGCLTS